MATDDTEDEHEIITAADVARLDKITKEILKYKKIMEESAFHIGTRLVEVSENRLYRARHETFEDYCENEVEVHVSTAHQYRKLALFYDEREFEKHGVTKLELLHPRLVDLSKEDRAAALEKKVTVEASDGTSQKKALKDCTVADLKQLKASENAKAKEEVLESMPDKDWTVRFEEEARRLLERAKLLGETKIGFTPGKNGEGMQITVSGVDTGLNAIRTYGILQNAARAVTKEEE